ncbi:MAG TPA: hypothetical protein VHU92_13730 [Streptosporangiaceae bacterium]|jgi:hypothetical protein|nr:hypothetical protein [Streptosporangiaceae bacterium]
MNDEQQIRELLMTAAELPHDLQPPVARLLRQGQRRRVRRRTLVAASAAVAVLAAGGIPATIHALRTAPFRPGSTSGMGLFGPRPPAALTGPAADQLARFRWSTLPSSPLGGRTQPTLAWTGRELIELGGLRRGGTTNDGAAFNPATGRWHRIASPGWRNIGLTNGVSVWTGRQLFVSNGQVESCVITKGAGGKTTPAHCGPQAGLYNPVTNRWTQTSLPTAMAGLQLEAAVWTGRDVIMAGVNAGVGRLGVAAYNPTTGHWRVLTPGLPAGHHPQFAAMTLTNTRLILWSLWDLVHKHGNGEGIRSGVDVLALSADGTWRDVTGRWPQHGTVTDPQFTGTQILVSPGQIWCGSSCSPPLSVGEGFFANPVTLAVTRIPFGPIGQVGPPFVWTGRAVIAVNEDGSIGTGTASSGGTDSSHTTIAPGATALFNPATRQWQSLPKPPGYPHLSAVLPTWTGSELLLLTARGQLLALHG